jgi:hypothetical protein
VSIQETRLEEFINDVQVGITDSDLIGKYRISAKVLKTLFNRLLDERKVTGAELYWRPLMCDESAEQESRRVLPRYLVASLIPVHYEENPAVKGWVFDLNEKGMRICGLAGIPGESRRLVFSVRETNRIKEIIADAECRWFLQESAGAQSMAGFVITQIAEENLGALRELIRRMTGCQFR